jgi:3-methyladenine DNA glycosylase AlkD
MNNVIAEVRRDLRASASEEARVSGERFFKESVQLYGVRMPAVGALARRHFRSIEALSKSGVFALCEQLWQSGYLEESMVACEWSYSVRSQFQPGDIATFERWVTRYVTNWASCDTLCNHTIGTLLEMYPKQNSVLKRWARSENRWMRRAAAVSLIVPARRGLFLPEVLEIADILLRDRDDMVQKGYGWLLKAAAEGHQGEVFDYVMAHKTEMPRTALRYAIQKMPADMKARAMEKGSGRSRRS